MKLKEQKILNRQKAKEELEKAQQIQKYLADITPEVLADYHTVLENLKTYCQQNPDKPVFMTNVSEVSNLRSRHFRTIFTRWKLQFRSGWRVIAAHS